MTTTITAHHRHHPRPDEVDREEPDVPEQESLDDNRDQVRRAVAERVERWSTEVSSDVGDSHDKGEATLCVGEAA